MDQGEEPPASRFRAGKGILRMTVDHLKVFASEEHAERWFAVRDPVGEAFEYEVLE